MTRACKGIVRPGGSLWSAKDGFPSRTGSSVACVRGLRPWPVSVACIRASGFCRSSAASAASIQREDVTAVTAAVNVLI